jgi:shikimate dehydrogenase
LSPALHNAAFAALGLDWVYVALPVAVGQVPAALAGVRALSLAGLSVTMPHKASVAAEMDRLSPTAAHLQAVNTVTRRGDQLLGDSTDGEGFLAAVRSELGCDPAGRSCLVLGAGGAARAVILALAETGAARVMVAARRREAATAAAGLAGPAGRTASVAAIADADLIVNATPVGMTTSALPLGLDPDRLRPDQVIVDLVYWPPSTPLLTAGRATGARVANGLGTLIHQAAAQCRLWTGMEAPLAVMSAAAANALSARGHSSL